MLVPEPTGAHMEPEDQDYWLTSFPAPPGMIVVPDRPIAFDDHFHLDRASTAMGLGQKASLSMVMQQVPVDSGKQLDLVGSCASFGDPPTYPSEQRLREHLEDLVVAVGLHPRLRFRSRREEDDCFRVLKKVSENDRVLAFGEVGLDHTEAPRNWPDQMEVLRKALSLVRKRHALVMHCRGMAGGNGTEGFMLLLCLVRKPIPADQRVYLNCFSGDEYVLRQWSEAFPNLYLGFTRQARSFGEAQIGALKAVADDRILLETDAPYFQGPGRTWSAPNQLYSVAEIVAKYRGDNDKSIAASFGSECQQVISSEVETGIFPCARTPPAL